MPTWVIEDCDCCEGCPLCLCDCTEWTMAITNVVVRRKLNTLGVITNTYEEDGEDFSIVFTPTAVLDAVREMCTYTSRNESNPDTITHELPPLVDAGDPEETDPDPLFLYWHLDDIEETLFRVLRKSSVGDWLWCNFGVVYWFVDTLRPGWVSIGDFLNFLPWSVSPDCAVPVLVPDPNEPLDQYPADPQCTRFAPPDSCTSHVYSRQLILYGGVGLPSGSRWWEIEADVSITCTGVAGLMASAGADGIKKLTGLAWPCIDLDDELDIREILAKKLSTRKRWFRCTAGHGQHSCCSKVEPIPKAAH